MDFTLCLAMLLFFSGLFCRELRAWYVFRPAHAPLIGYRGGVRVGGWGVAFEVRWGRI